MEFWLSVALFVLVASVTAVAGVRLWARPKAVLERVTGAPGETVDRAVTHPSLVFRDLVGRLGAALPGAGKDDGRTRMMLIRAGHRQPYTLRIYQGSRVLFGAVLGLLAIASAGRFEMAASERLFLLAAGVAAGGMAPGLFVGWEARARLRRIRRGLPDALDLLVICVESGLGLDQAIAQCAKELERAHRDISQELATVHFELKTGVRRHDALRNLGQRTGLAEIKQLVAVLIQADRFGTGIAQSLRTHAEFMRIQARQAAEEKAAKLGVKLVFPIFFCILPSLFVVTVGPMAARMVRELLPMMNSL